MFYLYLDDHKTITLINQDRFVFSLWPNDQQQLNKEQHNSVLTAVRTKFQLIQGPPGNHLSSELWSMHVSIDL